MSQRLAKRVLLVGWDAADWKVAQPLLDAGQMPALNRLLANGVMGNIASLRPMLSPMLWTSIATGKRAHQHGILGFIEPRADGSGIQPVSSTSRKSKALWNILTQSQMKSHVVNWYASHPAEPIAGCVVSEQFFNYPRTGPLRPAPPQSCHPQSILDAISELRYSGDDFGEEQVAPFVQALRKIPPDSFGPVLAIRNMLARAASVHAVATHLLESEPWDLAAIYYESIDHFSHGFMPYHPPRQDHIDPTKFEWFKDVVNGIYRFHDMMLERLLQLAGEDTVVIVVSDHGFQSDHLRPIEPPDSTTVAPEAWHRFHGMFVMSGPPIIKDERVYGASLLDVAPTVLSLLGLPVGQDMDGKALVQCFKEPPLLERIASWDAVEGNAGMHPDDLRIDPYEQEESLRQLVELGYLAAPSDDQKRNVEVARLEADLNLAHALLDAELNRKAEAVLEKLFKDKPDDSRIVSALGDAYLRNGKPHRLRELLKLPAVMPEHPVQQAQYQLMLGIAAFSEGDDTAALNHLQAAEKAQPRLPNLHLQIGSVYASRRNWNEAHRAFEKASKIDPDDAVSHFGVGQALLHLGQTESAVERLLQSVGLMHYFPRAHFLLGLALARMGWYDRACKALETCVQMRPNLLHGHRYLSVLYQKLDRPDLALKHRQQAKALWQLAAAQSDA